MGIPVGSKLFPAAFAGEAIDGPGALPDLISIIIPPFSAAGVIAEVTLPAGFRLFQKRTAVPAHAAVLLHHLHIGRDCVLITIEVILFTVVPDIVTA